MKNCKNIPLSTLTVDRIFTTMQQQDIRSLVVTASEDAEGATTIALAIARRLAAANVTTLLVDFDLTHASLSQHFDASFTQGGQLDAALNNNIIQTKLPYLSLLPCPKVGDQLISLRNKKFLKNQIKHWQQTYQVIVFDTSSVNSEAEEIIPSEILCGAADRSLLVVLTGRTAKLCIELAVNKIKHAGGTLLGSVLNDQFNPPLRGELVEFCQRHNRRFPKLAARLEQYFRNASWLKLEQS